MSKSAGGGVASAERNSRKNRHPYCTSVDAVSTYQGAESVHTKGSWRQHSVGRVGTEERLLEVQFALPRLVPWIQHAKIRLIDFLESPNHLAEPNPSVCQKMGYTAGAEAESKDEAEEPDDPFGDEVSTLLRRWTLRWNRTKSLGDEDGTGSYGKSLGDPHGAWTRNRTRNR